MEKIILKKENMKINQLLPYVIAFEVPDKGYNHYSKIMFYNNKTGKISYFEEECCPEEHSSYVKSSSKPLIIKAVHFQYDKDIDMMAAIICQLTISNDFCDQKEVATPFIEIERIYIDRNKNRFEVIKNENNECELKEIKNMFHNTMFSNYLKNALRNNLIILNISNYKKNRMQLNSDFNFAEFEKMDWEYIEMYKECTQINTISKFNQFIEDIPIRENYFCSIPKPIQKELVFQNIINEIAKFPYMKASSENKYGFIEKINENTILIRIYYVDFDRKKSCEFYRILISDQEYGYYVLNSINNFQKIAPNRISKEKIILFNETDDIFDNTKLKYGKEFLNELGPIYRMDGIINFLKYDFFEKLYKSNFKEILIDIVISKKETKRFHKLLKKEESDIYKIFQINKYQAEKMLEAIEEIRIALNKNQAVETRQSLLITNVFIDMLKTFQNKEDLDNESFISFFNMYKDSILLYIKHFEKKDDTESVLCPFLDKLNYIILKWQEIFVPQYCKKNIHTIVQILNICYTNSNASTNFNKYKDILSMIGKIKTLNTVNYKFSHDIQTLEELNQKHNEIVAIYNEIKEIIENSKYEAAFSERKKIWQNFTFEDELYFITYPETASDIAAEGYHLKHCVKSYINQVAAGSTNILFLRKKEAPEKPYYTIELSNEKRITQIHGFYNCIIPTNSFEESFIKNWMKEKNIKNQKEF